MMTSVKDALRTALALSLTFLLFLVCTQTPVLLAGPEGWVGPVLGAAAAFVGLLAWVFLVPSMPGLVQGAIHVAGASCLTLEVLGLLGLALYRLLAR